MIDIKTEKEIEIMAYGGKILSDVLLEVLKHVKAGVSELEIDAMAERSIRERGGEPGFMKVPGYQHAICVSTNDVVVHGIPTNYIFKEGDVVGIDCGVYYEGFHTDMSETIQVKSEKLKVKSSEKSVGKFLKTGKRALEEAIKMAVVGNHIGNISAVIQKIIEGAGYNVVASLIGHGVGRELHEEPEIPGFMLGKIEKTPKIKEGMTLAIEVIYNMGKADVVYANRDGWTIKTADGNTSGVFERTIAVTKKGPILLTK